RIRDFDFGFSSGPGLKRVPEFSYRLRTKRKLIDTDFTFGLSGFGLRTSGRFWTLDIGCSSLTNQLLVQT
ncbi:MAG TPA: hypothetical protein VNM35_04120, partial [Chitinophagaceae bacterium]|nr:hypothetical protein [Chitinophagaceae bacterium]